MSVAVDDQDKARRYVLYPISLLGIWGLYKQLQEDVWSVESVLPGRHSVFDSLESPGREESSALLSLVTSLRAARLAETLGACRRLPEVDCFTSLQVVKEHVHIEALSSMLFPLASISDHALDRSTLSTTQCIIGWIKGGKVPVTIRIAAAMLLYGAACKTTQLSLALPEHVRDLAQKLQADAKIFAVFAVAMHAWSEGESLATIRLSLIESTRSCAELVREIVHVDFRPSILDTLISTAIADIDVINAETVRTRGKTTLFTSDVAF